MLVFLWSALFCLLGVERTVSANTLRMLWKVPHSGYSEGLTFHQGYLWHALPKSIRKIDPNTGMILAQYKPATAYSESLVWLGNSLWNVSYSNNGLYKGSLKKNAFAFERVGKVPEKHAWGLTHNGKHLIVTGNYSRKLYFINPSNGKLVRTVETEIKDLEDLAWDGQGLWTSSFTKYKGTIFRLNPNSGRVEAFFKIPDPGACPVIDGIAYNKGKLWVTGKHCPSIYVFKKPSERTIASQFPKGLTKRPFVPSDGPMRR